MALRCLLSRLVLGENRDRDDPRSDVRRRGVKGDLRPLYATSIIDERRSHPIRSWNGALCHWLVIPVEVFPSGSPINLDLPRNTLHLVISRECTFAASRNRDDASSRRARPLAAIKKLRERK